MKKIILLILIVTTITACGNINITPKGNKKVASIINNKQTKYISIDQSPISLSNIAKPKILGKVIVIDPGHSNKSDLNTEALSPGSSVMKIKDGGGTQGIITKTPEYLINMKVSLKLRYILTQRGYTVIMTKTDNSLSLGNIDRAEVGNKANAALVIRIHCDGNDNTLIKGASVLVPKSISYNTKNIYKESLRCGTIILNNLTSEVGMVKRGVIAHDDMTGFNWSKVTVILVEMGFLSNGTEDKLLSSDNYQNKLARGIADGVSNAIKIK